MSGDRGTLPPFASLKSRVRGDPTMDWTALGDETVDLLRRYLMIDTTNPPGYEIAGAKFLAEILGRSFSRRQFPRTTSMRKIASEVTPRQE
jgi:hypothetical protein